jgi:hypothetical protein
MSVTKIGMKIGTEQIVKALSKIVNKEEAHKMAQTTAEKLWTGGKAEGEAKASREMLLEFLRGKFGEVPQNIERAINQMNDPIALDSWAAQAATSPSMEEFAEALLR